MSLVKPDPMGVGGAVVDADWLELASMWEAPTHLIQCADTTLQYVGQYGFAYYITATKRIQTAA
jgi:hypothetical protein